MLPRLTKDEAQRYLNMLTSNDFESKQLAISMLCTTRYKRLSTLRYWGWICQRFIERNPFIDDIILKNQIEYHYIINKLQLLINK